VRSAGRDGQPPALRAAERYQGLVEAGGWPSLPADLTVKPGERNPAR
jgi:hypothetical protein